MNLQALEIFRAVAIEGSVSKAATRLGRVQSNVSTHLKALEWELGKTLFLRRHRGLTLTPHGDTLLTYADRLLQLSTEATEALENGMPRGVFRIGATECAAAARLPAILKGYHERYPDVRIELYTDASGRLMDRLLNYDIDATFVIEPVFLEGIITQPVCEEGLVLLIPPGFPSPDNPDQMNGKTFVAFEERCGYRRYLDQWLVDSGVVPGSVIEVSSYLSMLACAATGTGYAMVPQCILDIVSTEELPHLTYALPDRMSRIRTVLAWRSDFVSAKLDGLKEFLPDRPS